MITLIENRNLIMTAILSFALSGTASAAVDSFFHIDYAVGLDSLGSPVVRAADRTTSVGVPVQINHSARFSAAEDSTELRISIEQQLSNITEFLVLSARCLKDVCVITDIQEDRGRHRRHVTVLK